MNSSRKIQSKRFSAYLVLLIIIMWPAIALGQQYRVGEKCLSADGATSLYNWFSGIAKEKSLGQVQSYSLNADTQKAIIVVQFADGSGARINVTPTTADEAGVLPSASGSTFSLSGFRQHANNAFAETLERIPPPAIWRSCNTSKKIVPQKDNNANQDQPAWHSEAPSRLTWLGLFPTLLPFIIAAILIMRRKRQEIRKSAGIAYWIIGSGAAIFLILSTTVILKNYLHFDMDSAGDVAAAQTIARGIALPLRGPGIYSSVAYLGPQYFLLMGCLLSIFKSVYVLYSLPFVAHFATLLIGMSFLRRSAGALAASLFALHYVSLFTVLGSLPIITHSFLAAPFVVLAVWFGWEAIQNHESRNLPLIAIIWAISIQFYAVYLFPALIALAMIIWRTRPVKPKCLALAGAAFLLPNWATFYYLIDNISPHSAGSVIFGSPNNPLSFGDTAWRVWETFTNLQPLSNWPFLGLFAIPILIHFVYKLFYIGKRADKDQLLRLYLIILTAPSAFLLVFLYQRVTSSHVGVLLPFSSIVMAVALRDVANLLPEKFRTLKPELIAIIGLTIWLGLSATQSERLKPGQYRTLDFRTQQAIAAAIKEAGIKDYDTFSRRVHGAILHEGSRHGLNFFFSLTTQPDNGKTGDHIWITRDQGKAKLATHSTQVGEGFSVLQYRPTCLAGNPAIVSRDGKQWPFHAIRFENSSYELLWRENILSPPPVQQNPVIENNPGQWELAYNFPEPNNRTIMLILDKYFETDSLAFSSEEIDVQDYNFPNDSLAAFQCLLIIPQRPLQSLRLRLPFSDSSIQNLDFFELPIGE